MHDGAGPDRFANNRHLARTASNFRCMTLHPLQSKALIVKARICSAVSLH